MDGIQHKAEPAWKLMLLEDRKEKHLHRGEVTEMQTKGQRREWEMASKGLQVINWKEDELKQSVWLPSLPCSNRSSVKAIYTNFRA